jgi:hypothetical protein
VQGLIGAFLVHLTVRTVLGRSAPGWYLGIVLVLAAATALPWVSGQIMPDVLAGYVILATFLLGYGVARMSRAEIAIVLAIDTLSIAAHYTHVALAVTLGLGVVLVMLAAKPRARDWLAALARLGSPALIAALALVLLQGAVTGRWGLATAPRVLTLARWIEDGPATAYLREECPTRHFALCDHLDKLPLDAFHVVFGPQSIVRQLGGPLAAAPEAQAVLLGTVRRFPLWVAQVVAAKGWEQLWRFETGTDLVPMPEAKNAGFAAGPIKEHVAPAYGAYVAARQTTDELPMALIRSVDRFAAWSSLALMPLLLIIFARRRDRAIVCLILVVASGCAANAVICGANSMPVDRFQARVIWLAVFVVLCGVARLLSSHRPDLVADEAALQQRGPT